jgi:N6-L-threonylcarbamoyladenine synthase
MTKPKTDEILPLCSNTTLDLIASFQRALIDDVMSKTLTAARECNAATLFVTGGVAANGKLREVFEQRAAQEGVTVAFPSRKMSTDNAAMIAAAAYPKCLAGEFAEDEFSAEAGLVLR